MKTIAIAGTFDTKGKELKFIKDLIEESGVKTLCIHTGVFEPLVTPDVSNAELAAAVGEDINAIIAKRDRATATDVLSRGMEVLVPQLFAQGKFDGIISIGGSGGTSLATPAMRALPVGVPKVMVSTMASGDVSPYVGTSDIIMIPSVVDAEGLNDISKRIFSNAVNALVGMVQNYKEIKSEGKPLLAATMFGVTTPCIKMAKAYLESKGYEVLVFHATGTGGRCMESLIKADREVNPDIMVICHGGPIAEPADAQYVISRVPEIDGFFGASSIERFAAERGIKAQAAAFKAITK